MHEQSKLKEAEFFLCHMALQSSDRQAFMYFLSAFLSAARSVVQYAFEEVKSKPFAQAWYEEQVRSSDIVSFFKDKRDVNIHVRPARISEKISMSETLHISDSLVVRMADHNGNQSVVHASSLQQAHPDSETPRTKKVSLVFPGWNGSQDVFQLCEEYLKELNEIVSDGKVRGFLTL
jgi:hypothetical protein